MHSNIAFIGWNPFQLAHVKSLLIAMPDARFLLEYKVKLDGVISERLLDGISHQIIRVKKNELLNFDGHFDIIVAQTPFSQIHAFEKTKIAMLQYGLAKEPHNYGPWRALADLNLVYGPYSAQKISPFSAVEAVGNPSFDLWHDAAFHSAVRARFSGYFESDKPTLVYAPTWGDLSSIKQFLPEVERLADEYHVLIKLHHNADLLERERSNLQGLHKDVRIFGAQDSLLELFSLADVVVSDYSGAIFDAILCERPVVLLDSAKALNSTKLDHFSLEYQRRNELGYVTRTPADLRSTVKLALAHREQHLIEMAGIRQELFMTLAGATGRAVSALYALADGAYMPDQHQLYTREAMRELYRFKQAKLLAQLGRKMAKLFQIGR